MHIANSKEPWSSLKKKEWSRNKRMGNWKRKHFRSFVSRRQRNAYRMIPSTLPEAHTSHRWSVHVYTPVPLPTFESEGSQM
jgi:hypothetical protein